MPRGKYTSHKGKHRRFTNPEELEQQRKKEEKERQWREKKGEATTDDEEEEEEDDKKEEESESESGSSEEDVEPKNKGVEGLIEISNPNRVQKKTKKLTNLDSNVKTELSRKEREELEKQRAQANYQRMHAQGKTDEARADLARLAIIKKQREEAAKRREEERLMKEAAKQSKAQQVQKALGKKST